MRLIQFLLYFFLSLFCCVKVSFGADYPSKPIKLVVPFSPGGGNDSVARVVAAKLSEKLGQQVFIDNKPGAGGTLGADFSAKSAADGYTIFLGGIGSLAINPVFNKSLPYHPTKDFEPIILLAESPLIVVATPKLPVNSIQQLTEFMRTHPSQINYASNGNGSSAQLAAMMYESMANIQMVHVPYKGLAPALADLLSGQVQIMFSSMVAIAPIVTSNRLKALAVTSKNRSLAFPQVPTMVEAGFPEYSTGSWYGLLAPKGTPAEIILKINRAANSSLQAPSVKEQLLKEGAEPIGGTPQHFKLHIQSELDKTLYLFNQQKLVQQ